MTGKQLRKAIRKSDVVFGWVNFTANDGNYVQLTKQSALMCCKPENDIIDDYELEYQAELRGNDLYIN